MVLLPACMQDNTRTNEERQYKSLYGFILAIWEIKAVCQLDEAGVSTLWKTLEIWIA
jgi:hypothetical protein